MSETPQNARPGLRLWPGILIVAVTLAVSFGFARFGSTNIQSGIGNMATPTIGFIVLLLWWLVGSRAAWVDRFAGLGVLAVCAGAVISSQATNYYGFIHLTAVMPVLGAGFVLTLLITSLFAPRAQRIATFFVVLAITGFGLAHRVNTVNGDFTPEFSWRWEENTVVVAETTPYKDINGTANVPAAAGPKDWPAFRGPERDGTARGITFSTDWAVNPPKQLWKRAVGAGHSSVAVVGDYLFTQEQAGPQEVVACYNALTGEPVWTRSVTTHHHDDMGGDGPRATPTVADGRVYAQSAGGMFQCFNAADGSLLWKQDLTTPEDPKPPMYGFSSSALRVNDLLLQFSSGAGRRSLIAFNPATGADVWVAAKDTGGYSSPHFATIAGVPQVLMLDSKGLQGFDPATGAMLWEHAWQQKKFPRCTQPYLTGDGGIILGANTDFGTRRVNVGKTDTGWDVKEAWTNPKHRPYFNDNVGHKGFYYGYDGNRLGCLDLATGEGKWEGTRYGGQVMLVEAMDMLLVLTEKGKVALVKADPAAFTEVAIVDAITGKTWNHPAIANGKLYVRNSQEMACFELPQAK